MNLTLSKDGRLTRDIRCQRIVCGPDIGISTILDGWTVIIREGLYVEPTMSGTVRFEEFEPL